MSSDDVKDCLRGRRPFPSLDVIDEKQANRLISNLISIRPEKRWSAIRAMTNATFKSADDTVQRAAGIDKVREWYIKATLTFPFSSSRNWTKYKRRRQKF